MRQFRMFFGRRVAMPLIEVTTRPGLTLPCFTGTGAARATRTFIRGSFGARLPFLFALNWEEFGMEERIPEAGVQVRFHEYGQDDINTADLWVVVCLSEDPPKDKNARIAIRNAIFTTITDALRELDMEIPSVVLDVFWGPTSGCGVVRGTVIEW